MSDKKENGSWLADFLARVVLCVGIGALAMAGMRAVEWIIPAPKRELMVCIVDDILEPKCVSASEELSKAQTKGVQL